MILQSGTAELRLHDTVDQYLGAWNYLNWLFDFALQLRKPTRELSTRGLPPSLWTQQRSTHSQVRPWRAVPSVQDVGQGPAGTARYQPGQQTCSMSGLPNRRKLSRDVKARKLEQFGRLLEVDLLVEVVTRTRASSRFPGGAKGESQDTGRNLWHAACLNSSPTACQRRVSKMDADASRKAVEISFRGEAGAP